MRGTKGIQVDDSGRLLTKMVDDVRLTPRRPVQRGANRSLVHARVEEQDVQLVLVEALETLLRKGLDGS